jgi:hypothetical protein
VRGWARPGLQTGDATCVSGAEKQETASTALLPRCCRHQPPLPALRQPAPLRIGQPQPPAGELSPKRSVFFDQMGDDVLLLVIQPAGQRGEKNPDGSEIIHRARLHHRPRSELQTAVGPTCGTLRAWAASRTEQATTASNCASAIAYGRARSDSRDLQRRQHPVESRRRRQEIGP